MTATRTDHLQTVRRLVTEVFNDGHLDRLEDFYAADCVLHNPAAPDDILGPDEWRQLMGDVRTAFPDFTVTIDDLIAADDKVIQRSRQSGTFTGEFQGIPPNGRSFETWGIVIYRFEDDGKIVEEWVQDDMMGMMDQLGLSFPQILGQLPRIAWNRARSALSSPT